MPYKVVRFPITTGGTGGTGGNPFPFIKPRYRESRNDPSHDIGVIAHGAYDIVDVGALLALQEQLNRTAVPQADKQLTVGAFDSTIPVAYGHVKVPALLANAVVWNGYWFFWSLWCRGVITEIVNVTINDGPIGSGGFNNHLGTTPQALDGSLFLALSSTYRVRFNDASLTFDQTADGIAYTTVTAPVGDIEQPPQINAVLRGLKVYDPRSVHEMLAVPGTWEYSRNPALILADFLRSTAYGAGVAVDDTSLMEAADYCDAELRTCDIVIDRKTRLSDWVATLATAANCYIDTNGSAVKVVPDSNRASVATFAHAGGEILGLDGETGEKRADLPTVIEVIYTDTTETTWKDASVTIQRVGVDTGVTPWRKSSVRMPWIQSAALATREAYLRMNKLWLRTPQFSISVMDEGVVPEVGDPVRLTYPDSGYSTLLKVKVVSAKPSDQGWVLGVFYDDPGAYVDDHIADPTPPTDDPDPFDVPAVENLVGYESATDPHVIGDWDAPTNWPYVGAYIVQIDQVGISPSQVERHRLRPGQTIVESGDLTPGEDYVITVWVRSVFGQLGPPRSVTVHLDAIVYTAFRYTFRTPTLVNMVALYNYGTGLPYWLTNMGDLWNPTFPNPLNTYTNALATYHTPGTSTLTTEEADALQVFNGDWAGTVDEFDVSGTATQYIELRTLASDAWVRHAGATFTGAAERVRLSSESLGTATQRVDGLGDISVTVTR